MPAGGDRLLVVISRITLYAMGRFVLLENWAAYLC